MERKTILKIALELTISVTTQRKYMNYDIQTCGGNNEHSKYQRSSFKRLEQLHDHQQINFNLD